VQADLRATGFFDGAIPVIENGIDLRRFQGIDRTAARADLGWQAPVLIYAGRITERKRVDRLLEASELVRRTLPSLLTVIAGAGDESYLAPLRARAQGSQVQFLGQRDDILAC
jgi:glycosyltransferase involved in cell wall biosynthesis